MNNPIHLYLYFLAYLIGLFLIIHVWGRIMRRNKRRRFQRMNKKAADRLKATLPHDFAERPRGIGSNRTQ